MACSLCGGVGHNRRTCSKSKGAAGRRGTGTSRSVSSVRRCSQCQSTGHDIRTCPSVRRCSHCKSPGHDVRTCPTVRRCSRCSSTTHDIRTCPSVRRCSKCQATDHRYDSCPKLRRCTHCKKTGHNIKSCALTRGEQKGSTGLEHSLQRLSLHTSGVGKERNDEDPRHGFNHNNSLFVKNINGSSGNRYLVSNLKKRYRKYMRLQKTPTSFSTCQRKGCNGTASATAHVKKSGDGRRSDDSWYLTALCARCNNTKNTSLMALRKNAVLAPLLEVREVEVSKGDPEY